MLKTSFIMPSYLVNYLVRYRVLSWKYVGCSVSYWEFDATLMPDHLKALKIFCWSFILMKFYKWWTKVWFFSSLSCVFSIKKLIFFGSRNIFSILIFLLLFFSFFEAPYSWMFYLLDYFINQSFLFCCFCSTLCWNFIDLASNLLKFLL